MSDYICPSCKERPQHIIENPATGNPHCPACGAVLDYAREEHERDVID